MRYSRNGKIENNTNPKYFIYNVPHQTQKYVSIKSLLGLLLDILLGDFKYWSSFDAQRYFEKSHEVRYRMLIPESTLCLEYIEWGFTPEHS